MLLVKLLKCDFNVKIIKRDNNEILNFVFTFD